MKKVFIILGIVILVILALLFLRYGFYKVSKVVYDASFTEVNLTQSQMFDVLTANTWCNDDELKKSRGGWGPTRYDYSFKDNGQYNYRHFSDYLEDSGSGNWNLIVRSSSSGHILLSQGDMLFFRLYDNGIMQLGNLKLNACDPQEKDSKFTIAGLPSVNEPALYTALKAATWKNTNRSSLRFVPTRITYQDDGKVLTEYRDGECVSETYISIRGEYPNNIIHNPVNSRRIKNCDERTNQEHEFTGGSIRLIEGNLAFFGTLFVPEQKASKDSEVTLVSQVNGDSNTTMLVEYKTPFYTGRKLPFTFEIIHDRDNQEPITYQSISIAVQPVEKNADGFSITGPEESIFTTSFEPITIAPGQTKRFTVEAEFPSKGLYSIKFSGLSRGERESAVYRQRVYYTIN